MDKTKNKSIKNWAEDDRPREKLLLKGASALSNAELIAILIGSGNTEESAVELSQRILKDSKDNFSDLARLDIADLIKYRGIGEAKAVTITAALEIGRRRSATLQNENPTITNSKDAYSILIKDLADLNYESFYIMLLNQANKVIKTERISDGGITSTLVDPKKIFKKAIDKYASGIILAHNHPSGQLKPSENDIALTKKLQNGAKLLDISIIDHIIVGDGKYFSFADEGSL